ncbi:hypothetical protein [Saccharothrix yanglingensis]|uniref:hypothetical protein n=1 Tax=Saccharothrix yanglingensis TaxID=659496 RepID=UPI0027D243C0|nr:hypothetical protein [Saccharothrix yanglingensis]
MSSSSGVGRLPGGAHRTADPVHAPSSRSPSAACSDVGRSANPARCRARTTESPVGSR